MSFSYRVYLSDDSRSTLLLTSNGVPIFAYIFLCVRMCHQVEYHVETFCDKNKDELPKESDELFASSPNPFVVGLFAPAGGAIYPSKSMLDTLLWSYAQELPSPLFLYASPMIPFLLFRFRTLISVRSMLS